MADLTFNFEIHHVGQFVWNLDLVYLGDSTSFINEVDTDKLSYFEIQDINGPSAHDGISVSAAAPHRPFEDLPMYATPHRTIAANNDPPLE